MLFELRVAARMLRARPLFTAIAVATLAVGIGSNAAIFSVINAVMLRPLPYSHADRLFSLYSRYLPSTGYDYSYFALSGPEFANVRTRIEALYAVDAYDFSFQNLTLDGKAERVLTMPVTAGFFDVLGVRPERGRTFTDAEAQHRDGCVAILGHEVSKRGFPGGADAIGATIRLDDAPCQVVGVMPEGFGFRDDRVDVWTGLSINAEETPLNRGSHPLLAVARLREGARRLPARTEHRSARRHAPVDPHLSASAAGRPRVRAQSCAHVHAVCASRPPARSRRG